MKAWVNQFVSVSHIYGSLYRHGGPHDSGNQQSTPEPERKKPHIKKPLNAFMLFMKEMRAKVVAECTLKESAAINQILGRRVSQQTSFKTQILLRKVLLENQVSRYIELNLQLLAYLIYLIVSHVFLCVFHANDFH